MSRLLFSICVVTFFSACGDKSVSNSKTPPVQESKTSTAQQDDPSAPATVDPVASMKALIDAHEKAVAQAVPVVYSDDHKKWTKLRMRMENIEFDVKKSDSLVSPFVGEVSFDASLQHTDFFDTEEEAATSATFSHVPEPTLCRVMYAFQDGKWETKKRTYFSSEKWRDARPGEPDTWPTILLMMQ